MASVDAVRKHDIELAVRGSSDENIGPQNNTSYGPNSDDDHLRRLGKRPLLTRSFGFMSILGFACSALLSWEGVLSTSVPILLNGGPAGVIWAYLANWVGMLSVNIVLGELVSIAPTAGGQYHWVALMAPEFGRTFLTYLTAWLTTMSWQFIAIAIGYITTTMIQGIAVLAQPSYEPQNWHTVLILWAVMLFAVIMNSTTGHALAKFEGLVLVVHLTGFFGILIPMVYLARHNDPEWVFTTFINQGGWSTQALSILVSFPTAATSLIGADCAVHMSEEIQSASIVVPRALVATMLINGSLAFAMIISLFFCVANLDEALAASDTMFYPFLEVFRTAVRSRTGACVMAGLILILNIASSVGIYASASRMLWSFARDKGVPFHKWLVKLTKTALPINAIFTTLGTTMLLSLIILGSAVALSALISLITAALFSSYFLVCGLLLWRRSTNALQTYTPDTINAKSLSWGPWRVPEPFGMINNFFACIYSAFLFFWSFWPQVTPVAPDTMNWCVLVFGTIVLFCVVWYFVRARHYFTGPIKEV